MSAPALAQFSFYVAVLLGLAFPLGRIMAYFFQGKAKAFFRIESWLFALCGVDPQKEMDWKSYAQALLLFNALGVLFLYVLLRLQGGLPANPQSFSAMAPHLAFNTAVSFVTNTNWQAYPGEKTLSHLSQMLGLGVQNFLSAATGIAVALALTRGFFRHASASIGNFWVDVTRATLWLLLPLSLLFALALAGTGVIQNFSPDRQALLLEPQKSMLPVLGENGALMPDEGRPLFELREIRTQTLPMGPVASQEAIKLLGTNGGGFFNTNSSHPFENPTPFSNFLEMLAILLIPAALCITFGEMVKDRRQGVAILAAMTLMFIAAALTTTWAEGQANPLLTHLGADASPGNIEGKETRFGAAASALFATITTSASCGAVNAMHDSFTPLGGLVPMWLMQIGEVVFGGVGTGLYTMLAFAMVAVFVAGLMVGRTPEYLGKKIESFEIKMVALVILVPAFLVLVGSALAALSPQGRGGVFNPGPHGFSEILYALSSAANNNGSAFAGLAADSPFYAVLTALAMWFGRFALIIPLLAIAGSLAAKKRIPPGEGTFPTHGLLFVLLLIATVLIVGALGYFPALALGPVVEHFLLQAPLP